MSHPVSSSESVDFVARGEKKHDHYATGGATTWRKGETAKKVYQLLDVGCFAGGFSDTALKLWENAD
ncbi:unnamed protein product, partial [Amoebophrya sp. A25]|eukprot:GSA25T00006183001.1